MRKADFPYYIGFVIALWGFIYEMFFMDNYGILTSLIGCGIILIAMLVERKKKPSNRRGKRAKRN